MDRDRLAGRYMWCFWVQQLQGRVRRASSKDSCGGCLYAGLRCPGDLAEAVSNAWRVRPHTGGAAVSLAAASCGLGVMGL